jgi:beta-glucosidase
VTLHHFTLPQWVARSGGWLASETAGWLAEHARASARELGDLVDVFFTINEPTVLSLKAYAHGMWPPGRRIPHLASRALRQQLRGHAAAYHALKSVQPETPTGPALNLPSVSPDRPDDRRDLQVARVHDWMVNGALLTALSSGACRAPIGNRPRQMPELKGSYDFIGVNYYGRYRVRFAPDRPGNLFGRFVQQNSVKTESADWGEPSPPMLVEALERAAGLGVPVYVSENGRYDPDDSARPRFIVEHVRALRAALGRGLPLRGYFHWSLIDNFEWAQGWTTPFGLIAMDPTTMERRIRPSARVYAAIARNNDLPDSLATASDVAAAAKLAGDATSVVDPYGD